MIVTDTANGKKKQAENLKMTQRQISKKQS